MGKSMIRKLRSRRGINRLIAIVLILVLVLGALLALPGYRLYKKIADEYGCKVSIKKAQDMLDVEFLGKYSLTKDEALVVVERAKMDQDTLCPAGGDFYLVDRANSDQVYRVTCGLHEPDTKLRTRLNAYHVYELLQEELVKLSFQGEKPPLSGMTFTVNSQPLFVQRLSGDNGLHWGTNATIDYDGVVCFYSMNADNDVNWFCYADENHAAVWTPKSAWTGDAFNVN